jgi:hypothetical protein
MTGRETEPPMIIAEEIHHSIADADDIEQVLDPEIPVGGIVLNLIRHPLQLLTRWNWKSVVFSIIVRDSIYLVGYLLAGEPSIVIITALLVDILFRVITTGVSGSVTQSFRHATPQWLANLIVSIMLPAVGQVVEFFSHYIQENYLADYLPASIHNGFARTFPLSLLFAIISTMFNLYLMRQGVLLVGAGEETLSIGGDLKRIPMHIVEFIRYLPDLIAKYLERGKLLNAFATFCTFGIAIGAILGGGRWKWDWAWKAGMGAWGTLLGATVIGLIVRKIRRSLGKQVS